MGAPRSSGHRHGETEQRSQTEAAEASRAAVCHPLGLYSPGLYKGLPILECLSHQFEAYFGDKGLFGHLDLDTIQHGRCMLEDVYSGWIRKEISFQHIGVRLEPVLAYDRLSK